MTTSPTSAEPTLNEIDPTAPKSLRQPAWHVVLLSIFTLSLYLVYWFHKTVRDLKSRATPPVSSNNEEPNKNSDHQTISVDYFGEPLLARYRKLNPFWVTVALLTPTALGPLVMLMPLAAGKALGPVVPLLTLTFFAVLYYDIARLARDGTLLKNNPTFPAFCLVVSMAMLWGLVKLPSVYYLLFTLVSVPPAIAQHWLNDYWQRVEPENAHVRSSFSMAEIITLLLGSIPLTLIMLTP
jgi:hypothetical protein